MRRIYATASSRARGTLLEHSAPSVCVIGAGNGGLAMAGHLGLKGLPVRLYARREESVEPVRAEGGIHLRGAVHGFGPVQLASTDLEECVRGVDVIMVTTPASAHVAVANALAPYLNGQLVVLNPGRTGGALEVARLLRQHGAAATVVETETFIYASRKESPVSARIYEVKRVVPVAAFPAVRNPEATRVLRRLYPQFVPASSVLETSLTNIGAIFHPVPLILNTPNVEHGTRFEYYHRGITPRVADLMERLDEERVAVAAALGLRVPTAREWLRRAYGATGNSLYEAIQNNAAYSGIEAPSTLDHRYIYEDVPTGLVPLSSFGQAVGVPTPYIDSLIQMASGLHGTDYRAQGRTLKRLGLSGMDVEEIREYVITGSWSPSSWRRRSYALMAADAAPAAIGPAPRWTQPLEGWRTHGQFRTAEPAWSPAHSHPVADR